MVCPCTHPDKKRRILRFSTWKSISSSESFKKYNANAESLLAFLCSNCHVLRPIKVPFLEEDCVKAKEALREILKDDGKYGSFLQDIDTFNFGECTVQDLYDKISSQYFTDIQSNEDKDAWTIIKYILQIIEDPERQASLHLRHLKLRPRIWTPCCNKEHCFRCRTKDFHTGKSCEQNTKSLDSTIVPCPACGLYLTKGDGCNSVTCVCGKKFSWSEEKETNERTNAFYISFPDDTSKSCAEVLCQTIEGNEVHALAWRSRHQVAVNQSILKHWRSQHPYCPHQAISLLDTTKLSAGKAIAVEVWEAKYSNEVLNCRRANEKSRESLFLSLYPTTNDRFIGARRILLSQSLFSEDSFDHDIRIGAKAWVSKNSPLYDRMTTEYLRSSSMQFMTLFGQMKVTATIPGKFHLPCADSWNLSVSNTSLSFSNNNRTTKRPGSVSSYPAAFANIPAERSSICVEVDACFTGPNWLTFGLARRGMENSGSDGVGLTADTWGISDERDNSSEAYIGNCGRRIGRCPKFQQGDIIKGEVDLSAGWFEVTVGAFSYRFDIPIGSCEDYYFAMTFANNHQVSIIPDPFSNHTSQRVLDLSERNALAGESVYHLNPNQSEMYFNLRNQLIQLSKPGDNTSFDHEFLVTWSSKWEEYVRIKNEVRVPETDESMDDRQSLMNMDIGQAYNEMKCYIDMIIKDDGLSPDWSLGTQFSRQNIPTWDHILGACCWSRLHFEEIDRQNSAILSHEFIIEHQDSASFIAAYVLSPNVIESSSPDTIRRAKAYMILNPDEMNEWYDYNVCMVRDCGESLVAGLESVPTSCRCLPRHVKTCQLATK